MFKKLISKLFSSGRAAGTTAVFLGRRFTKDVAIIYRMVAGFAGDVNRSHPASIEPVLVDATAPPGAFGIPVVIDPTTQGVRPIVAGDSALTDVYGITVRPYPFQQSSATNYGAAALGAAAPPATGVIDVLRQGYIMAVCNNASVNPPIKGSAVYVWYAVSTGNHVQGGLEAAATGGSTFQLPNSSWNGGVDANGVTELIFRYNP